MLELFKAAQSYPHESALKKQCCWTKQYLEMELSSWVKTSVRDKYLKKEVISFAYLSSCESYLRIEAFSGRGCSCFSLLCKPRKIRSQEKNTQWFCCGKHQSYKNLISVNSSSFLSSLCCHMFWHSQLPLNDNLIRAFILILVFFCVLVCTIFAPLIS